MDEEINWNLRGVFTSIAQVQQDVAFALADGKFTPLRKRDLLFRMSRLSEQIAAIDTE